jgi:hypothetical protein
MQHRDQGRLPLGRICDLYRFLFCGLPLQRQQQDIVVFWPSVMRITVAKPSTMSQTNINTQKLSSPLLRVFAQTQNPASIPPWRVFLT